MILNNELNKRKRKDKLRSTSRADLRVVSLSLVLQYCLDCDTDENMDFPFDCASFTLSFILFFPSLTVAVVSGGPDRSVLDKPPL